MQISQMMNQYEKNTIVSEPPVSESGKVSSLSELIKGQVFYGVVDAMSQKEVTITLSNGQSIAAKLLGDYQFMKGQSVLFEVKSHVGSQLEIRPCVGDGANNTTLYQALDAAGVSLNKQNVELVQAMMEQQMSIDKGSIGKMVQLQAAYPQTSKEVLAEMVKYDFPVNEETIRQFVNYKNGEHFFAGELKTLVQSFPDTFFTNLPSGKEGAYIQELVQTVLDGMPEEAMGKGPLPEQVPNTGEGKEVYAPQEQPVPLEGLPGKEGTVFGEQQVFSEEHFQKGEGAVLQEASLEPGKESVHTGNLQEVLSNMDKEQLQNLLGKVFPGERLPLEGTPAQFLERLQSLIEKGIPPEKLDFFKELMKDSGFQKIFQTALEQSYGVRPEEVSKEKMQEFYERLGRQMASMEQLAAQAGKADSVAGKTVSFVRENLNFMQQMNQVYQYVQIPLTLKGKEAHSDLYVYTNKKQAMKPEGELTAYLHLEMEHLGTTNVSISMRDHKVRTHFYLENEEALDLVEAHLDQLTKRLEALGYGCSVSVDSLEKEKHAGASEFEEAFLQKQAPARRTRKGKISVYSFDVRA